MRILEFSRREELAVGALADTIATDPTLAARILRFVISPMSGLSNSVAAPDEALALLGPRIQ